MAERNYAKESEWRKKKYKRLIADFEPEKAEDFKARLEKDGVTYKEWLEAKIDEYLKD